MAEIQPVLIIGARDIRKLLPMAACIELMDQAMRALSTGRAVIPSRLVMPLENDKGYLFLMPGSMSENDVYGAKIVSLQPENPVLGKPAIQGFITLFERQGGTPAALLDGAEITATRTAAASALATRELARSDARRHGIFGTGVLAAAHLEAIACVRDIKETLVWGRDSNKAHHFATEQARRSGMNVRAVEDAAEAAACGIVSVVTNSPQPILQGRWLQPGCHINLVGAHNPEHREADSEAVTDAAIYVDSLEGALRESGDILIPISEGRLNKAAILGEIGAVLAREVPGRSDKAQKTLYKSLGVIAQDLLAAEYVYRKALEAGVGTVADLR